MSTVRQRRLPKSTRSACGWVGQVSERVGVYVSECGWLLAWVCKQRILQTCTPSRLTTRNTKLKLVSNTHDPPLPPLVQAEVAHHADNTMAAHLRAVAALERH